MSIDTAIAALEASRQRMRGVMIPHREPDPEIHGHGVMTQGRVVWRYLRRTTQRHPALRLAVEAVQGWWMAHPVRQLTQTVAVPINDAAVPVVRRHPWTSVAVAASAGAALAVARPWRWNIVAQQARQLRRQVVSWGLALAGGPMGQAVIASLLAGVVTAKAAAADEEPPATQPDVEEGSTAAEPQLEPVS